MAACGLVQAPFQLTSFALALLLVFRVNNSYDRWVGAAYNQLTLSCTACGLFDRAYIRS